MLSVELGDAEKSAVFVDFLLVFSLADLAGLIGLSADENIGIFIFNLLQIRY